MLCRQVWRYLGRYPSPTQYLLLIIFNCNILDIPIVPTFSFITKMAVEACMQLREVRQAVDATDEILMGKISKSHTWLQQFEILSQFLNESTNTGSNHIIQVLIECLQPLKVATSLYQYFLA